MLTVDIFFSATGSALIAEKLTVDVFEHRSIAASCLSSPWRNASECASEDEVCGNEKKWVRSLGQPGEWAAR